MIPTCKSGPIVPKSWTSRFFSISAFALLGLTGCLLIDDATAGKRGKKNRDEDEVVVEPEPVPVESVPLFRGPLPFGVGPIPAGLPNTSAQGCAACHFDSHTSWTQSGHANGWRGATFRSAVRAAANPACNDCHLPLIEQRPLLYGLQDGVVELSSHTPNPAFDATLRTEGVTCAVCHVREGKVISANLPSERGPAPHETVYSEELRSSEACATCHQLQWPGANQPFYDTYGEWKASAWSTAGVSCQDCHGGAQAGAVGFEHSGSAGHAVSVLIGLPQLELVRGEERPLPLTLTLQNTGAGHAFPTGSPFTGALVVAEIVGPPSGRSSDPTVVEALTQVLGRTVEPQAPWNITEDTRLQAGATQTLTGFLTLPHEAPAGAWELRVQIWKTVRGERTDRLLQQTVLPLNVE